MEARGNVGESSLSSDLKILGLSDYQARSLLALMAIGVGTPRDVARKSGIPYPSVYDSLRSLAQNGWVEFANTRPSIFRVKEPALMKSKISEQVNRLFAKLQQQYENIRDESPKLALIYTIVGEDHVRAKILEMLDSAISDIVVVVPSEVLVNEEDDDTGSWFVRSLDQTTSRQNVRLRLITDRWFRRSIKLKHAKVRVRDSVLALDLLVDRKKALIGMPDFSVCGWVESPVITSHFGQFLDLLWKDSREFREKIVTLPDQRKE